MKKQLELALFLVALVAVGSSWLPAWPSTLKLVLVMVAGLLLPARAILPAAAGGAGGAALSPLLIAATWALLAGPLGSLPAARIALAGWAALGAAISLRRRPSPAAPFDRAAAALALALVAAAFVPLAANPSLWMRTEARLFLPLVGEVQGGSIPPTNPFTAGTGGGIPWMFAALMAPFRALTGVPASLLAGAFQVAGLAVLLTAAQRWTVRLGGGRWAGLALPALLVGGLTAFGFRNLSALPDLDGPLFRAEPLLRAMTGLAGDATVSGLFPRVWGVSPMIWTLACVAAAGSLAEGPRFRLRSAATGALLGAAMLLHPVTGITATGMWLLLRVAGSPEAAADRAGRRRETVIAGLVAAVVALPHLLTLGAPFAELPLAFAARLQTHRGAEAAEALPLFALAAAALAGRRDRRGWIVALGAGALWGLLDVFSAGGFAAFLWAALLFAGIPAALGLDRLARRGWGAPVAAAVTLLFLATPAVLVPQALADRSGEPRWTEAERLMFARADRALPPDAVLLTLPTTRSTSEEQLMLSRPAYLGPEAAVEALSAGGDTTAARIAAERGRLLSDFTRGRNPMATLDRMADDVAPRPLVFVISSEDAARHDGIVDLIYPTAVRFEPLENSETLKILLYHAPERAATPAGERTPPNPRIILRPADNGEMVADTIGVGSGAPADSAAGP